MSIEATNGWTKKFSKTEKLRIIIEAKTMGVKVTMAKYGIFSGTCF